MAKSSLKSVAVHDGRFHADEVFSIAALQEIFPLAVIRSRESARLERMDIRIDVGAVYNPETGDFDHHQRGGAGVRENGIPYAAFGLIWKEFGVRFCKGDKDVADLVEEKLVMFVDADDNGYEICEYKHESVKPFTISNLIWDMNECDYSLDAAFSDAVALACSVLARVVKKAKSEVEARRTVAAAINASEDDVVFFDTCSYDWAGRVAEASPTAKFVIFPSESSDYWYVQCVPPKKGSFEQRQPLAESLAGLRDEALVEASGIQGAIFVHPGRFIGGVKTKEGAIKLAKMCGV